MPAQTKINLLFLVYLFCDTLFTNRSCCGKHIVPCMGVLELKKHQCEHKHVILGGRESIQLNFQTLHTFTFLVLNST